MLPIPDPDLRALATGETIVAFVPRAGVTEGDEVVLVGAGPRPAADLKPAYRRWASLPAPPGEWHAVVVAVHPASLLAGDGAARHVLAEAGGGDVVLLRVSGDAGTVLSDAAFAARWRSAEAALGT